MPDSSSAPAAFGPSTRPDRIALLLEVFEALVDGRQPSLEARLFVGGGGLTWMRHGGRLTRDHWRVDAERGSHRTVEQIAARLESSSSMTASVPRIDQALAGRRIFRCADDSEQDDEPLEN